MTTPNRKRHSKRTCLNSSLVLFIGMSKVHKNCFVLQWSYFVNLFLMKLHLRLESVA